MSTLILAVLIARSAAIDGTRLVWTCTYLSERGPVALTQERPCEPAITLPR